MLSLRDDLKDKTTLPVFANAYAFIFIEQFVSTLPETVRNLALAATAIVVVTSLFLVNPLVILLVLLGFASLIFELLGKPPALHHAVKNISQCPEPASSAGPPP
jgi:hypothetical protein